MNCISKIFTELLYCSDPPQISLFFNATQRAQGLNLGLSMQLSKLETSVLRVQPIKKVIYPTNHGPTTFYAYKNISGRLSLPYMGAYALSKFAVEAFTDALRIEVCHWDMKISLIEPGFFKTNMTGKDTLASPLVQSWSKLSEEKKLEYGEEFLKKSEYFIVFDLGND